MNALTRLLALLSRRRMCAHNARAVREELRFVEHLLDSIYPIDAALIAQRQRLIRALDAHEGIGTQFGEPA